jgi:DNA-binding MarR family transcriptional regulator
MGAGTQEYLHHCLYFTSNRLARAVTRMAEEEFAVAGLSPAGAFIIMLVDENPGLNQKELGGHLHLAQSTITRFIDKLESKGLITRRAEGKNSYIYPSKKGIAVRKDIERAWQRLYGRYSALLGVSDGEKLTALLDRAGDKLEKKL